MTTRKQPKTNRAKLPVTIDPGSPEAGTGGVVPPPETRFKPGESGNPNGRPKGAATSLDRVLERELERLVEGDPSLGDDGRISRRLRLVRALLDAFEGGDARAGKLLFDRIWPVPVAKEESKPAVQFVLVDAQDLEA